ncbi:MAG: DUF2156 domain-containing protein [Oribacterium sp.]|nr:DUF2156 domain-containing protein [Oribacterium sp.]
MLNWVTPSTEILDKMKEIITSSGEMASDLSVANIFLLRHKYDTKVAIKDGFLYRWYRNREIPGRNGVTVPIGNGDISAAMQALVDDRKERGLPLELIFVNKDMKQYCSENNLASAFETHEDNWDYIYSAEHLAKLEGSENIKKRNRVNRFARLYPDWQIRFADQDDTSILQDMLHVEDEWLSQQEDPDESVFIKKDEIYEAIHNWSKLSLLGAVIYCNGKPAAMTIASQISDGNFDIHFEKSYGDYAKSGAFSAINKYFSDYLYNTHNAQWINREEDMGILGLRKAKMSYCPDIRLEKYVTKLVS